MKRPTRFSRKNYAPCRLALLGAAAVGFGSLAHAQPTLERELISPDEPSIIGFFGVSVDGLPDITGDGRGDVIVGAPAGVSGNLPTTPGRAYVIDGATGTAIHTLTSSNPEDGNYFGQSVGGVGDVDSDGVADVIVGAPSEDDRAPSDPEWPLHFGRVYVFSGATGDVIHTLETPNNGHLASFGYTGVIDCPDMTGDNVPDILASAMMETWSVHSPQPSQTFTSAGRVYLFNGATGAVVRQLQSPNCVTSGFFGSDVAWVPDTNGDSVNDILIGAMQEVQSGWNHAGRAYLFSGANGAILHSFDVPSGATRARFGNAVAGIADISGDGRGDLLIGSFIESRLSGTTEVLSAGRVYVMSGADGSLIRTLEAPFIENDHFGSSIDVISDQNGDGSQDILIGEEKADRVYIFNGADGAIIAQFTTPDTEWGIGLFGRNVRSVPDMNNDGKQDIVVGSSMESPGSAPEGSGRAYIFSFQGSLSSGLAATDWQSFD